MAAEINGYEPGTVAHLYLTRLAVIIVIVIVIVIAIVITLQLNTG